MRNILLAAALAGAAVPAGAAAAEPRFGAGAVLGVPFGVTAKYALDGRYAVQSHAGVSEGNFSMNADFLRNFEDVLPRKVASSRIPVYAGLGLKVKTERETFAGIRFVGGVSMFHSSRRYEFFAEVAPVLRLAPSEGSAFDGAFGMRRWF